MSYMQVVFVPIIMLNSKSLITEIKFEWKQICSVEHIFNNIFTLSLLLRWTIALDNNKNGKRKKPSDIFFLSIWIVCVLCVVHMGPHLDVPA